MKPTNAPLFVVVGLIVLFVFGLGGYQIGRYLMRDRSVTNLAKTEVSEDDKLNMSLGNFQELDGTPYLMAPVTQQDYRQDSYQKKASGIHNYLFFNTNDKSAQRLVTTNDFLFLNAQQVVEEFRAGKVIRGMWYEVVTADTNNDKRLDEEDQKTIAVSDISGADYTEVIDRVDRLLGSHQENARTLLIFYELNGRNFVGQVNIPQRKLIESQPLPDIK